MIVSSDITAYQPQVTEKTCIFTSGPNSSCKLVCLLNLYAHFPIFITLKH